MKNKSKYKDEINKAYDIGFARGWDSAYDLPKCFGARLVAAIGYQKGVKHRYKSDKYIQQYTKQGKKLNGGLA